MSTVTHTALLVGLQTPSNDEVWSEFYARYQPLLISVGRRLGLSEQDAADAAQETLLSFSESYQKGSYDRTKGRLRTWLFGIAIKKIRDVQRRNGKNFVLVEPADKSRILNNAPDDHSISEVGNTSGNADAPFRRRLFVATWKFHRSIELFVLKEWPADKVASHLGVSRNAVFKAKRRVLSRKRETYKYLQANW